MEPPKCERRAHEVALGNVPIQGDEVRTVESKLDRLIYPPVLHSDDLYWLRDDCRKDEAVLSHLRLENAYADFKTSHLVAPAEKLYAEIRSRIRESDNSVPVKRGSFYYYVKTEEGKSYPAHCRRSCASESTEAGPEVVYFDENVIADGHEMCDVSAVSVSDLGDLVAYSADFSGSEEYTINFLPAPEGDSAMPSTAPLPDTLQGTSGQVVWHFNCSTTVYYSTLDDAHRPYRIFRHTLGTDQSCDVCIFEELNDQAWVQVSRTTSRDFLVIRSATKMTSAVVLLPLSPRALELAERCNPSISVLTPPLHVKRKSRGGEGGDDVEAPVEGPSDSHPEDLRLLVLPKAESVLYDIDHFRGPTADADAFVILTNQQDAANFQIMCASCLDPSREQWRTIVPPSEHVYITDVEVHSGYLAFGGREDGYENVWWIAADDLSRAVAGSPVPATTHRVPPLDSVYVLSIGANDEYETNVLRFAYCSPTTPDMVCELSLAPRIGDCPHSLPINLLATAPTAYPAAPSPSSIAVLKQRSVPNVDLSLYKTARVMAVAADGAHIPISLLYRESAWQSPVDAATGRPASPCPLLLYAYGAYGISWDPTFSSAYLSLCDRGMVYAIAHVRGGGEMGRHWYLDGKLLNKKNTFSDYIACSEHLCQAGWTEPGRIVAQGGSAGGLLVAAVLNERPELFAGAVLGVPFVDAVVTMADSTIPLVSTEWDEVRRTSTRTLISTISLSLSLSLSFPLLFSLHLFLTYSTSTHYLLSRQWGNPNERDDYAYIKSYSPIDNVRPQHYPRILLEAGLTDYRVGYWEVAKFAQRLREVNTNHRETIFRCEMDEGHTGAMDRYRHIKDIAEELAYVLDCVALLSSV